MARLQSNPRDVTENDFPRNEDSISFNRPIDFRALTKKCK